MATTSPQLAFSALDAMREAGVRFALLHGRDRLLDGEVSDVDLAVSVPVASVISRTRPIWGAGGLLPVVVWPYDVGGTATVFLTTEDAGEGVQLDLLHDTDGRGRYGVRSEFLVDSADASTLPSVSKASELVYLWRKRTIKGQQGELASLSEQARRLHYPDLAETSAAITGSVSTAEHLVEGVPSVRPIQPPLISRAIRIGHRVAAPVGFWAHTLDERVAEDLVARFSRFLVRVGIEPVPQVGGRMVWWVSHVQPVRVRPGLFASFGPAPRWPNPDVVVASDDPREAARLVTAAMSRRI